MEVNTPPGTLGSLANIQMENSSGIFHKSWGLPEADRELLKRKEGNLDRTECPGYISVNMCGRTLITFWKENGISTNLPLKQISQWCYPSGTADDIVHIQWLCRLCHRNFVCFRENELVHLNSS